MARRLAALVVPILVMTSLGHHFAIVPSSATIPLISISYLLALAAVTAATAALIWIWYSGDIGVSDALAAYAYTLPILAGAGFVVYGVFVYPAIIDVQSDLDRPLLFWSASMPAHANARRPAPEIQRAAYPEVSGRLYPVDLDRVFDEAEKLARARNWALVLRMEPATGGFARLEYKARSPIIGYDEHVALHMRREAGATRVDMRSRSHFGRHDIGQNARRIAAFMEDLDDALQGLRQEVEPAQTS